MIISSFQIQNYKCFLKSKPLSFSDGFNVLVGQNNSGKTSLLEALALIFDFNPNKKMHQKNPGGNPPLVNFTLSMTGEEFAKLVLENRKWELPVHNKFLPPSISVETFSAKAKELVEKVTQSPQVRFLMSYAMPRNGEPKWGHARFQVPGIYDRDLVVQNPVDAFTFCAISPFGDILTATSGLVKTSNPDSFVYKVGDLFKNNLYFFHGERMPTGTGNPGASKDLQPRGENLAQVLNVFQTNKPNQWEKFNELVSAIIPSIYKFTVPTKGENQIKVEYWTGKDSVDQDGLAIELDESGTGVKHVLSLLYVVLTAEFPKTIIIDEPNSYLHPGAVRKLIAILKKDFPQHQYIVATHSPQVIRDTDPNTLTMVSWGKEGSTVEMFEPSDMNNYKSCLVEVGAKLSDVFGADEIFWVEGETEEICFPLILKDKVPSSGINIVNVRHTGDFESKRRNPEEIFKIYEKLSQGNALIPPAISFVFDSEGRTDQKKDELEKISGGKIKFLPRRSYENYLLVPHALASYISKLDENRSSNITEEEITSWFKTHGDAYDFPINRSTSEINPAMDSLWIQKVNAPKLLNGLFQDISETRLEFKKLRDSPALTQWLLDNNPELLTELTSFLEKILKKGV